MATTFFLQSEVQNPYKLYEKMLRENPVYWDNSNNHWAVYSYEGCKAILSSPFVQIPETNQTNKIGLNEYALSITSKLARLSNGVLHEIARHSAMHLFDNMKAVAIGVIIENLLDKENNKNETDWVNSICKKLPVAVILKSFDFNEKDCDFISGKIEQLIKIMLPNKTLGQVEAVNEISKKIYTITERHLYALNFYKSIIKTLSQKYNIAPDETASFCVINLIGLFIQSYDAGRGILSNSLLQIINNPNLSKNNFTYSEFLQKSVIETLRFDPPIHNTKRVAVNGIALNDAKIKEGEAILIVLAAANRDSRKFSNPNTYNIERANNSEHLTFGIGSHNCIAKYFSVSLATEALSYLLERYKTIKLLEKNIQYEPMVNARLPRNIYISLT
ncbi:MAG: cytochrome P450 [Ginsengibacter sp.]